MRWFFSLLLIGALLGCSNSSPVPDAQAATKKPTVVVIGDSITAGYIPVNGVLQLRQDLSYTTEIASVANVVTAAVGGASSKAVLGTQVPWLRSVNADVVVVMIGTNDAVVNASISESLTNVRSIADTWPTAKLIVVSPPKWEGAADNWLAAWSIQLQTFANSRGGEFVDVFSASQQYWYCHPTDKHPCTNAHREMGLLVSAAVSKVTK